MYGRKRGLLYSFTCQFKSSGEKPNQINQEFINQLLEEEKNRDFMLDDNKINFDINDSLDEDLDR
ncbi:hypothetical protein [Salipaludibacillus daqingensis]|uniref:hypothetical protein n=1 Tax=Salipaludibacillus daqingensis TaxID=3041001 RepID=UPI002473BE56|nr:hypothetical protein [Salipaludibacillus daqingensis]